ncbi:MAG: KEOPS complex subunit Pcc1 [Candidatus Asgardarchaeia archaeon]
MYPYLLTLEILFDNESDTQVVYDSIYIESKAKLTDRSITEISKEKNKIILIVKAKDITALRAAVNSYLRLLNLVIKIQENIKEELN